MEGPAIRVRGARTHNLKDVDLDLPRGAWTIVCGVSGSGKSSLVLDTLGAESRRRFLGTLPRASRTAVDAVERPDVDGIEGLPPAVVAGFLSRSPGARETLGTLTEVTHALRALFVRAATPHCPVCDDPIAATSRETATRQLLGEPAGTRLVLLAPRGLGPVAFEEAVRDGFVRVRLGVGGATEGADLPIRRVEEIDPGEVPEDAEVQVVVDRLIVKPGAAERFAASVDQGLDLGGGVLVARIEDGPDGARETTFADRPFCGRCLRTWPRLSTALFSSNSPTGACPTCEGRGVVPELDRERVLPRRLRLRRVARHLERHLAPKVRPALRRILAHVLATSGVPEERRVGDLPDAARTLLLGGGPRRKGLLALLDASAPPPGRLSRERTCPECEGARLDAYPRAVRLGGATLFALESLPVDRLRAWLEDLELPVTEATLAGPPREDALQRLRFLEALRLDYLAPARAGATLSGGELRRARLAAACAARMSGLLFLLDEPSAGLHPADRPAVRRRLRALVDEGNTVVCVEHDPTSLEAADHLVELGPGAGAAGGEVLAAGAVTEVLDEARTPMATAARAELPDALLAPRRTSGVIEVRGARLRTLQHVDVDLPCEGLTCLVGVSGSGKSTFLLDVLAPAAHAVLDRAPFPADRLDALRGLGSIDRVSVARGAPSRHPRATPGTVLGVLPPLRRLFAATLEARSRGWAPSRFSRHVKGGRCEACRGLGVRAVALRDLPPVRVRCEACDGAAFAPETLQVRVKGLSIADVLALPIRGGATLFRDIPTVSRSLRAAVDVGLGYVPLGEPTNRLSSGEALRLKLAAALGRGGHTPTLYLLDEPSAGLHPHDVAHLARVLLRLTEDGNTVVAVEHHPWLIRQADHVVELGPGPGEAGGHVVFQGPPAELLGASETATGPYLSGAS